MSDASLILATRNAKKLAELRRILEASSVGVSVTSLSEYPDLSLIHISEPTRPY